MSDFDFVIGNDGYFKGYKQGKEDAIEEFDKRLDLRIEIGNTVMLMADSKFYEAERKNIYNQALDDVDNIITEQLDKSDNQVECQTLRWVLDVLSDLIK